MKELKIILVSMAAVVAVIPGISYFTDGDMVPDYDGLKGLMTLITQLLCFVIIGLAVLSRKKIQKMNLKRFKFQLLFGTVGAIIMLSAYVFFLDSVMIKGRNDLFLLEPLWHTQQVQEHVQEFGGINGWVQNEGIRALWRQFEREPESQRGIFWTKAVLVVLYCVGICLFLFSLLFIALRIEVKPENEVVEKE